MDKILLAIGLFLVFAAVVTFFTAPFHWVQAHMEGDPLDPADPDMQKSRSSTWLGWGLFVAGALCALCGLASY